MKPMNLVLVLICGALFGFGLALSTMIQPEVILAFLAWNDFGLMLVLGGAAGVTMLAYQFAPRAMNKPLLAAEFGKHPSAMSRHTLLGAAIFGAGWGLSGVCPGPAIAGLGAGNWPLVWALTGIVIGAGIQGWWASRSS